ncbi:Rho termination factor N-terminal domain-containing protein [Oscillatoria sp. FACHB-1407]|uniref:Rho termination factor N-terminal domain-containing protein n=1 Tax=Oscillatoria sp. FACHB-1407 TaxID=2692847 RepID=UPI0016831B4F|nr:Rho termination factor N-terminal domain-containing protein [Oscillatoria sp. FACHB-1407]MBD2462187.1 Rho termination factor N-terminal domain-containing protein [Oscillatoria sp. FACHB-1407]
MSSLTDIGNLMYLYLDEIYPGKSTNTPRFLVKASADFLKVKGGHNWVPVIVKETGEDQYEVIGNAFIYAVAKEARLERVWCIIADASQEAAEISQVLSGEVTPKINLSTASRDEIEAALQYLIDQPGSVLKGIKLPVAVNRIEEAPRQYWKNFDPVIDLKCGITKGKKLDALKQVFVLTPQPLPDIIKDAEILKTLTTTELKAIAKKRGLTGTAKLKKPELIELLSQ